MIETSTHHGSQTVSHIHENIYDEHPHTSASIAFENFYLKALKTARKRNALRQTTGEYVPSDELQIIMHNAGERLGIRKIAKFEKLSEERKNVFLQTFGPYYQDYLQQDVQVRGRIDQLIEDGHIPHKHIRPDGTFDAKKIQESPYFLDNHKQYAQFEFGTRQMLEENVHRKKAKDLYDIEHAGHNHGPDGHHHDEDTGDACCPTHRKKEISLLRTQRKYGNYPRLAKVISKVKELGWLLLCPGDDIANLANSVVTPLLSDGDMDDHHHKEPDAYVPRTPLSVVHEATEIINPENEWELVDFTSAKVADLAQLGDDLNSFDKEHRAHTHCSHSHNEYHHHRVEALENWREVIDPVHARLLFFGINNALIPATPQHLTSILQTANEISFESRHKCYKDDIKTFDERNIKWNADFWQSLKDFTDDSVDRPMKEERVKALRSLGINLTDDRRDGTGNIIMQAEYFRKKYVSATSSDIGRFVEDIANGCTDESGSVDLNALKARLNAIEPMLGVFGTDYDVHVLVKDFAIAHGILTHSGQRREEIVQHAKDQLDQHIPYEDEVRLHTFFARHYDREIQHIESYANKRENQGILLLAS